MFNILKRLRFPVDEWPFRPLLLALLAVDVAFIALHLLLRLAAGFDIIEKMPLALNVISDDGLPEMFNHLKWVLVVLCLVALFLRTRVALFAAMAVVYSVILLDDKLGLHERWGEAMGLRFGVLQNLGLAPHQVGELIVWAALGTIVVTVAVLGIRLTPKEERGVGLPFLLAFLLALFCAIGLDVAQDPFRMIPHEAISYWIRYAIGIAEDGGEMVAASLTLAVAVTTLATWRAGVPRATGPVAMPGPAVKTRAAR